MAILTYELPAVERFDWISTGVTLQGLIYRLLIIFPQTPAHVQYGYGLWIIMNII